MKFVENQKINTKTLEPGARTRSTRDGFGEMLLELGNKHKDVVVLSADLTETLRAHKFRDAYPKRFFQMGVAEQNMAAVSTGFALDGKVPFMCSFAVYSPGRNWDQIRVACYSKANIKIVGGYAGFGNGGDGALHQAFEDLALTLVLPNMTVLSPCDFEQTKKCVAAAYKHKEPVYIRTTKILVPDFTTTSTPFEIGKANVIKEGKDITLVGTGPLMHEVIKAAKELEEAGISCEIINVASIKPLDEKTIIQSAKKTGKVVTIEEHQINSGFSSLIARVLSEKYPVPMKCIAMPDTFGESGKLYKLIDKYQLGAHYIVKAVKNFSR